MEHRHGARLCTWELTDNLEGKPITLMCFFSDQYITIVLNLAVFNASKVPL